MGESLRRVNYTQHNHAKDRDAGRIEDTRFLFPTEITLATINLNQCSEEGFYQSSVPYLEFSMSRSWIPISLAIDQAALKEFPRRDCGNMKLAFATYFLVSRDIDQGSWNDPTSIHPTGSCNWKNLISTCYQSRRDSGRMNCQQRVSITELESHTPRICLISLLCTFPSFSGENTSKRIHRAVSKYLNIGQKNIWPKLFRVF